MCTWLCSAFPCCVQKRRHLITRWCGRWMLATFWHSRCLALSFRLLFLHTWLWALMSKNWSSGGVLVKRKRTMKQTGQWSSAGGKLQEGVHGDSRQSMLVYLCIDLPSCTASATACPVWSKAKPACDVICVISIHAKNDFKELYALALVLGYPVLTCSGTTNGVGVVSQGTRF